MRLTETQRLQIRNTALSLLSQVGQYDAALATALSHYLDPVVAQMLAAEREAALNEAADLLDRLANGGTAFNAAAKHVRALTTEDPS